MEFLLGYIPDYSALSTILSGTGRWVILSVLFAALVFSDSIARLCSKKDSATDEDRAIALKGVDCAACMKANYAPLFKVDVRIDEVKGAIKDIEDRILDLKDSLTEHITTDKILLGRIESRISDINQSTIFPVE